MARPPSLGIDIIFSRAWAEPSLGISRWRAGHGRRATPHFSGLAPKSAGDPGGVSLVAEQTVPCLPPGLSIEPSTSPKQMKGGSAHTNFYVVHQIQCSHRMPDFGRLHHLTSRHYLRLDQLDQSPRLYGTRQFLSRRRVSSSAASQKKSQTTCDSNPCSRGDHEHSETLLCRRLLESSYVLALLPV